MIKGVYSITVIKLVCFYNQFKAMHHKPNLFNELGSLYNYQMLDQMIINPISNTHVKKIFEWNQFPCYSCGGDTMLVGDCTRCHGVGRVKGDDPMVRMIEQIIDSKLKNRQERVGMDSLQNTLGVDLSSSTSTVEIHDDYDCDVCKMFPIRGKRFHCPTCETFDVCEQCSKRYPHRHKLELGLRQLPEPCSEIKSISKQMQKSKLQSAYISMATSKLSKVNDKS